MGEQKATKDRTENAFLMMWDMTGIEAVIPISEFEDHESFNAMRIVAGEQPVPNPLDQILTAMKFRARFNSSRNYEIYAIDCEAGITKEQWLEMWDSAPQATADLVRARGVSLYTQVPPMTTQVIR